MTLRALHRCLAKHQVGVTQTALHGFVQPLERIAGLAIVIEFGDRAQGRPAYGCVAIAARNSERPMRVARGAALQVLPEHPRQHAGQAAQHQGGRVASICGQ